MYWVMVPMVNGTGTGTSGTGSGCCEGGTERISRAHLPSAFIFC